jgi:hypothetical protein
MSIAVRPQAVLTRAILTAVFPALHASVAITHRRYADEAAGREPFSPLHIGTRRYEGFQMVIPLAMLAVESGGVVALRMMKLMLGGSDALYEAELMVSEKVNAAFEATASLIAGASGHDVIHRYRQHVAANAARLAIKR